MAIESHAYYFHVQVSKVRKSVAVAKNASLNTDVQRQWHQYCFHLLWNEPETTASKLVIHGSVIVESLLQTMSPQVVIDFIYVSLCFYVTESIIKE